MREISENLNQGPEQPKYNLLFYIVFYDLFSRDYQNSGKRPSSLIHNQIKLA